MAATDPPTPGEASDSESSITVEELRSELLDDGVDEDDAVVEEMVRTVKRRLFGDQPFEFEEAQVKTSLPELLIALIAVRSGGSNGKQLIQNLSSEFDTSLSPGTVYPALHELNDEGVVEKRELVRTKEYSLADYEVAGEMIATAAQQHLALGMVFKVALDEQS